MLRSISCCSPIRTGLLAATLAGTLLLTQGRATADREHWERDVGLLGQSLDQWKLVDGRFELNGSSYPDDCAKKLEALTDGNVPESITFDLAHDIPELKAGKHPWTAARAACKAIVAAVDREAKVRSFAWWADMARAEVKEQTGARGAPYFKNCLSTYDDAIKAGIPPTEPVTAYNFNDTMQAIRDKWCAPAMAEAQGAQAAAEAPYRKVLKNDKLKLWLKDTSYIMLAGNPKVTPARLAAARVWFEDATPERFCSNGAQVHTLYRFQFDANHKLVKSSEKTYCGHPPASAWR
jgi:hypothetical protein